MFSARNMVIEPTALKTIVYALMLAMLALSVRAALIGEQASPDVPVDDRPGRAAIEMTAMIVLLLLMSPMSGLSFCRARCRYDVPVADGPGRATIGHRSLRSASR